MRMFRLVQNGESKEESNDLLFLMRRTEVLFDVENRCVWKRDEGNPPKVCCLYVVSPELSQTAICHIEEIKS